MASIEDAVECNNLRQLELMVQVPGSVSQTELNNTLRLAVKQNKHQCVQILLSAGATEDPDDNRESLLHIAAREGYEQVVQIICDVINYNVNAASRDSLATPLHLTCRRGHAGVIRVLLHQGADPDQRDSSGCTSLITAAKFCPAPHITMKKLVDADCGLNHQDDLGKTALHYCCKKALGVELLLRSGADPDYQDIEGNTPMHSASTEGFDAVVKTLLEYKANPNIRNKSGRAPIHYLAMKNHWSAIEAIATSGGDVDICDYKLRRPVYYAVTYDRPDAVKALLRANCSVHPPEAATLQPTDDPLRAALHLNRYGIAQLLALAGARIAPVHEWLKRYQEIKDFEAREEEERSRSLFPGEGQTSHDNDVQSGDSDLIDTEELTEDYAVAWFSTWVQTPHTLRQQCRIFIRGHVGSKIVSNPSFPVPQCIRHYLTLREVDDIKLTGFHPLLNVN